MDAHGQQMAWRPPHTRQLLLLDGPGEVRDCREFTREALTDWGWFPTDYPPRRQWLDDTLLLVSELVTNAFLHGLGPRSLRLQRMSRAVRVEVTDQDDTVPHPRPQDPHRPGGFGLNLVRLLATDWGVTPHRGGGKSVWATIRAP